VTENTPFVFSTAGSDAIGIVDAAGTNGGNVQLSFTATHGTLSLATTAGLSFTAGANHAASMTIVGSLSSVLAALNGLTFTPTTKYVGTASIKMTAKDLLDGQSGSDTIALKVAKVAATKSVVGHHSSAPAVQHSSPPPAPVSAIAGGDFLLEESNYWAGLEAAIELMNRP